MSAVRFTSKAEQLVAAGVRAVVADLVVGETVRDPLGDLVLALEYYAGELAEEWLYGDCFDGIIIVGIQKSSEFGLAIRGTGILISDQTEIAIWLDVRADPDSDRIVAGSCRLGIPDDDTGELVRVPFGAREALRERALVFEFAEDVSWMIEINIKESRISGRRRTVQGCTECQSLYFEDSSKMADLCPECAHQLYDHPRCNHEFRRDRCIACFWDGAVSDYLDSR